MSCCIMSPIASSAASVDLCHHNSFHGVFVLSSHHMTVPSQSGLLYFVSNACHSQRLSSFLSIILWGSKYPPQHSHFCSPSTFLVIVQASTPNISTGIFTVLYTIPFRYFAKLP